MSRDRFSEMVEVLLSKLDANQSIEVEAIAQEFGIDHEEVRSCLEGLRSLQELADPSPEIGPALEERELRPFPFPDDYEPIEELGRGGMGVVFRARQKSLDREVAIKLLRSGEFSSASSLARFRQETLALARLQHPHIVTIHEVGEIESQVYFTMDLIEGGSLHALLKKGRSMTPSRAVNIMRQVASAISYIHERGLVHRDLKPHNILIGDDDHAFVTDFGLVRKIDEQDPGLTLTGQILGTPAYMSPEQARGDSDLIGEATDVWAMGVVLFELLCGRRPFRGDSAVQVLHQVIHDAAPHPRSITRSCPPDLEAICLCALQKDPAERYATAHAFL
ncbi:MAG: serine/threonine-protein kinase [Planctomycetota bacterium]